ncbi:unnamed protein product [Kuraishia capsulata CBS 1993]|uniref:Rho GDP-dissociation inhibitor n=1 Tax=Kuraishia capsulata CBS 1993 TaxID=1382522 RepID=W6MS11_9ASCO|nr:uncharacterized protein KUCA_T00005553001 [Kuraishia capsulata CBS 1993]CDK29561.1 unnamed protein product [Kuraishia capsulata CBS 1993]
MSQEDDLIPEDTPGFVVGEKKTIEEYAKLDAEDESLAKWKASLGITTDTSELLPVAAGDKRRLVILEMVVDVEGQDPIIVDFSRDSAAQIESKKPQIKIKEGSIYTLKIKFRVQHEIVTGVKYLQAVKKAGITVDRVEEPCGSFPPNTVNKPFHEKQFPEVEAPKGMLARGSYSAVSKFIDDDKTVHLAFPWTLQIVR